LGIDVGCAGVVAVNELSLEVGREGAVGYALVTTDFVAFVPGVLRAVNDLALMFIQWHLTAVVEIPVAFRGDERKVRFLEADGEKEGLVTPGEQFHQGQPAKADLAVGTSIV
jgi:hypothetical protein